MHNWYETAIREEPQAVAGNQTGSRRKALKVLKSLARALLAVVVMAGSIGLAVPSAFATEYRRITFPVQGSSQYRDDFGEPRSGGRTHEGNDVMSTKLQHLVAATSGRVSFIRHDTSGLSGNMLTITDSSGWSYRYIHINNDTPGTDDGANPIEWAFAPGIEAGARVKAGDFIAYLGDSGNAEGTAPHLHFEVRRPDGSPIDPWASLRLSQGLPAGNQCRYDDNPPGTSPAKVSGYWVVASDGGVFSFGDVGFYGSTGAMPLKAPILGMAASATGNGYWLVAGDGGIFAFGDTGFYGSTGGMRLKAPVVAMAPTRSGDGYWLVASDGGIFAFGDAGFYGSTGALSLKSPVVGMSVTPSGNGYWLVASDGGIFAFGDAGFYGSTGAMTLAKPIIGMAASTAGDGYWLLGKDGGIFAFGDVGYYGSLPGMGECVQPEASGIAVSSSGNGYWIQTKSGGTYAYGDAAFLGAVGGLGIGFLPTLALVPAFN